MKPKFRGAAMEQLSDQELCEIFAKIPFSKSKVSLQAVSARWRRVVTMPQSHILSTFIDDQEITVAEPIICPAVLRALSGVKLEGDGTRLLRLPLSFERLQGLWIFCPPGGHCPTLPRLHLLQLLNPWGQHEWLLNTFPVLACGTWHEVVIGKHGCYSNTQWSALTETLSQMRTLRVVRLYFDEVYILLEFQDIQIVNFIYLWAIAVTCATSQCGQLNILSASDVGCVITGASAS